MLHLLGIAVIGVYQNGELVKSQRDIRVGSQTYGHGDFPARRKRGACIRMPWCDHETEARKVVRHGYAVSLDHRMCEPAELFSQICVEPLVYCHLLVSIQLSEPPV